MQNGVVGANQGVRKLDVLTRIEIAIEAREIAAGDFQSYRVAAQKHVASCPKIYRYLVNLARIHEARVLG